MNYTGSCHCGAVQFAFRCDEIRVAKRCNCSICIRRGILVSPTYVALDRLEGAEALAEYRWASKETAFRFCRTCGVHPFHEADGLYRINLGCVAEVDALALPVELIDGRAR
ncbi:MAG: GFA family protein [Kofleriaceae bacterium]